ncbi:hypothetical protein CQ018_07850 [Arthrobacter sp. MYb227]|uniref:Tm-1-like ATP-binding domain-containing protein n=1 Tax=Arthrobacter sp. MYb227 TaxID=1848601 RepID=UPI000CFAC5BF|nr:Tm-1-like ATP-binding domain-containing protein [Arthrobacter sp. MYb227]PQZ93577.1 hypothetical protein CQ018_07850 [Arthrobacter sp. MYb227]
MSKTVVIVATLDTKGVEIAYLRDALQRLGIDTLVVDSGVLGEPVGIVPDFSHEQLCQRSGITLHELQNAGSRGKAVAIMRRLVSELVVDLFAEGRISGGISVGGVGSIMGAAAIQQLPLGVPKIVVAPTASGHHEFGPYVGTKDVMVVHSVVDILGLNEISKTIFDNVAAAMYGLLAKGHPLDRPAPGARYVATTMLGNTTTAVGAMKDRLSEAGYETVVFHSNGVGGPAMEELAASGQFVGVIDYTTNEIADPLTGGIHDGGPHRLRTVGLHGIPQIVLPGCMDFSVFAAGNVPRLLGNRPVYDHNPEYTLVRTPLEEMHQLGEIFARRLNESTGPIRVLIPTRGLSIPSTPDGPFWDPEADAAFLTAVRRVLRPDIPLETIDLHINDPELGRYVAELFLQVMTTAQAQEICT